MQNKIFELELNTLYAISQKFGQVLDLDHTLMATLEILSKNMAMERGTVTLKDQHTGLLKIIASHGLDPLEQQRGIYHPARASPGRSLKPPSPSPFPTSAKSPCS